MVDSEHCPFCGSEKVDCYEAWPHYWACQCDERGASLAKHGTKEEAIETWNTRAESEQEKCNRERLVQIGEAVAKKEPIHFLAGETYVPERTCKNKSRTALRFVCSRCGESATVYCEEDFEDVVNHSSIINYCPNCGARVVGD